MFQIEDSVDNILINQNVPMVILNKSCLISSQNPGVLPSNNPTLFLVQRDTNNERSTVQPTNHQSIDTTPSFAPSSLPTMKPATVVLPTIINPNFLRRIKMKKPHYLLRLPRNV